MNTITKLILLMSVFFPYNLIQAQGKKKSGGVQEQPKTVATGAAVNGKSQIPVLQLPPVSAASIQKGGVDLNEKSKVKPNYNKIPNQLYSPEQIKKFSQRAPLLASLTARTPYYTNATLSCSSPYEVSTLHNWILLQYNGALDIKSALQAGFNLSPNKKYLCTVKYQGKNDNVSNITIDQNSQFAQDFHLEYQFNSDGEFSFVVDAFEGGWRLINLYLNSPRNAGSASTKFLYIKEWTIKELSE